MTYITYNHDISSHIILPHVICYDIISAEYLLHILYLFLNYPILLTKRITCYI